MSHDLTETENLARLAMTRTYQSYLRKNNLTESDVNFGTWLETNGYHGKSHRPRARVGEDAHDAIHRLAPDWKRRAEIVSVRAKTIFRIYLSKWFWRGVEWYELELLLELARYLRLDLESWVPFDQLRDRRGTFLFLQEIEGDRKKPVEARGFLSTSWETVAEYLYSEAEFTAVWMLRSVQSMRDFLFQPLREEHEGKLGIRKPRQRGYRDGKASPRDPRLTAMARQVDVLFWEEKFHQKWNDLERELNAITGGVLYPPGVD